MSHSRWQFLKRFDINDAKGRLYLRRWYLLQMPWFGIYLHKIAQPDKDPDMHDHPWSFVSLVLLGGYEEQLSVGPAAVRLWVPRKRGWLSLAFRRATDVHRIRELWRVPTWTLVLVGRRVREWGFQTDRGFVPWRDYLLNKATHRCKVCGALWRLNPADPENYPPPHPFALPTWSLVSPNCGKCCDNVAMGGQLEELAGLP